MSGNGAHPDWQLNFAYFKRFPWPDHFVSWHKEVATVAIFEITALKSYAWPDEKKDVEVIITTQLCFHEPHELFKKTAIKLSVGYGISIQEPEKHVYRPANRSNKKWESIETS